MRRAGVWVLAPLGACFLPAFVCLGVVPATDWLAGSDLHVDNGVVCDQHGRASAAGVWAVGDMARWRSGSS